MRLLLLRGLDVIEGVCRNLLGHERVFVGLAHEGMADADGVFRKRVSKQVLPILNLLPRSILEDQIGDVGEHVLAGVKALRLVGRLL